MNKKYFLNIFNGILVTSFLLLVTLGVLGGINIKNYTVEQNNFQYTSRNDGSIVGSPIGATEVVEIYQLDDNGAPTQDVAYEYERDIRDFNPYADYGMSELERLYERETWSFVLDTAPPQPILYNPDYLTLYLETAKWTREQVNFTLPEDVKLTYDLIKDDPSIPNNVKRVVYVMPEILWDTFWGDVNQGPPPGYPDLPAGSVHPKYTYAGFLFSVARYPSFCGEKAIKVVNNDNPIQKTMTMEQVCSLELASNFGNFAQETGSLVHVTEMGSPVLVPGFAESLRGECSSPTWSKAFPCGPFYDSAWNDGSEEDGPTTGSGFPNFQGRGPKQLSYIYNYGPFSRMALGTENMAEFLTYPWRMESEKYLFLSAQYFGMTPRQAKPSIHWIATGLWSPTPREITAGIEYGFGAITNVINGGVECGALTAQSVNRARYFQEYAIALEEYLRTLHSNNWKVWTDTFDTLPNTCERQQQFPTNKPISYRFHWDPDLANRFYLSEFEEGPFNILFAGDSYRMMKSRQINGGNGPTEWDWEAGRNPNYRWSGAEFYTKAYHPTTGWIKTTPYNTGEVLRPPTATINVDLDNMTLNNINFNVSITDQDDTLLNTGSQPTLYLVKDGGTWENVDDVVDKISFNLNGGLTQDLSFTNFKGSTRYQIYLVGEYWNDDIHSNKKNREFGKTQNSFITPPPAMLAAPNANIDINYLNSKTIDISVSYDDFASAIPENNPVEIALKNLVNNSIVETKTDILVDSDGVYHYTFRNLDKVNSTKFQIEIEMPVYTNSNRDTTAKRFVGQTRLIDLETIPVGNPIPKPEVGLGIDFKSQSRIESTVTFMDVGNALTGNATLYLAQTGTDYKVAPIASRIISNPANGTEEKIIFDNLQLNPANSYYLALEGDFFETDQRVNPKVNQLLSRKNNISIPALSNSNFDNQINNGFGEINNLFFPKFHQKQLIANIERYY